MDPTDITVKILEQIRDEAKQTNSRLGNVERRLDSVVQEQIRQSTTMVELVAGMTELNRGLARTNDAATQVVLGLAQANERIDAVVDEVHQLGSRIDSVLTGAMGQ